VDDPTEALRRWLDSGGHLRVFAEGTGGLTVALLTCDGGEEMGRLTSGDPEFVALALGSAETA
jgi:hypothetical protein